MIEALIGLIFYVDIDAAIHDVYGDGIYVRQKYNARLWNNPLLSLEWGMTSGKTTLFIRHTSSTEMEDTGLNVIGIRHRIWK